MTHLLEIYIARHCFRSPETLRLATEIKRRLPRLRVQIKVLDDITPAGTSIFATPSYLLDGRLIFLGNPQALLAERRRKLREAAASERR